MKEFLFNSSCGMRLDAAGVVGEILAFMEADRKRKYRIAIGTDSEALAEIKRSGDVSNGLSNLKQRLGQVDFVTAIVVHRVGNGGRYFWRRLEFGKLYTLRDRIIKEVIISLEVARELLEELRKAKDASFDFEIHADIGENGQTKAMIQEVVGMIRAYNFTPQTKPGSYAASSVADRHV